MNYLQSEIFQGIPHRYPASVPYRELVFTPELAEEAVIHQVAYLAGLNSHIAAWFIHEKTKSGDLVCDVFAGRGTTGIEASRQGRSFILNDLNPLMPILARPRVERPNFDDIGQRLQEIPFQTTMAIKEECKQDLLAYFSPQILAQLLSLRQYLLVKQRENKLDQIDRWLRFVMTERLLGSGETYFSYPTLPSGFATRPEQQRRFNQKNQADPGRKLDIASLIQQRSGFYLDGKDNQNASGQYLNQDAANLASITKQSVDLQFTSPPYLNTLEYVDDNWLRLWMNGFSEEDFAARLPRLYTMPEWCDYMNKVLKEQRRFCKSGAINVWAVAERKVGDRWLDEILAELAAAVGFQLRAVYHINLPQKKKKQNLRGKQGLWCIEMQ
ncbi:MAG TPA: DNA methyltransferase [Bacillota bacterium]|nr:DNA methyltransferase [Bacillota bacterium]